MCNELQRIVRYFEEELNKLDVAIPAPPDTKTFVKEVIAENRASQLPPMTRLNNFADELRKHEKDLRDISENYHKLLKVYNSKLELKYVLEEALKYSDSSNNELLEDAHAASQSNDVVKFSYLTGVIDSKEYLSFQKMIFRSTRGNCFVRFAPILGENKPDGSPGDPVEFENPDNDEKVEKQVFIAMFPGRQIESQLRKICDAYGASIYNIPDLESPHELNEEIRVATEEIADARHIKIYNRKQAESTGAILARRLQQWKIRVNMELGTYDTLNKLEIRDTGVAVGKGWVLASAAEDVANLVRRAGGADNGGSINESPRPWPTPPTHFITNKYTGPFQGIVNTYGVPDYQEANPAIITMITFPFSFAIMFGDVGHGLCWLVASIYMIAAEKSLLSMKLNETVQMVVNARYMLFLMSFFAVYNGFIYNDTFALGVTYFGDSQWQPNNTTGAIEQVGVYPFGLDPVWKIAGNEILFGNSLKMKLSVTFGVLHMVVGVFFKGSNKCFFKDWNGFFNEFVPQIIFILSFFGYMIVMIFIKWCTDWAWVAETYNGGPPSLISTLVNIALAPGSVDNGTKLYGYADGDDTQSTIQLALLIIAFVCIPWMLIPKPLIENCQNKRKAAAGEHSHGHDDDDEEGHHEVHGCGDLFIHQVIETIEYVLGCVSNTASYLRLWALSLAHMELSKTFWDLIMVNVLNLGVSTPLKAILLFLAYSVFAAITVGVLLAMDFLECFLHALRLHWVEFQNKFFSATGYAFEAFSFERIVKDAQAEEAQE